METNVFKTLRMEQDEVLMCRFLADLLDPKGWHGCGAAFLRSFLLEEFDILKNVNKEKIRLESTCVMTEFTIDNGRRIDIMLQNPMFSVPIEVKINARDQEGQCYDYYKYAQRARLVYLTKNKTCPSAESRKGADGEVRTEEICCISWDQICDEWLANEQLESVKHSEIFGLIQQYKTAIKSFLAKKGRQKQDCSLAYDMLREFQDEIDVRIRNKEENFKRLEQLLQSLASYDNWERNEMKLSFFPGLNYRVNDAELGNGEQMWFRIEVGDDGYLTAGICLVDAMGEDTVKAETISLEQLGAVLDYVVIKRDNWWVVWRYSNGKQDVSRGDVPNFKTMNEKAQELQNGEKRKEFVKDTLQILEDQLLTYLTKQKA